ncbi:Na/Pi cotransporter family protein, partial [bacterium]|nr:Na/Pi cotransporter family protein [bacterium]
MFLLIVGLLGGLALFLYGIQLTSEGLKLTAGARLRSIMMKLTSNRLMGVTVGVLLTVLNQSSSATTVMLVSLASAGLIALGQALGVILGASIGTTLTVQLIAFKIYDFALLIVAIGFGMMFLCKKKVYKYTGQILLGFGLIFHGMRVMSTSMHPLQEEAFFKWFLISLGDEPLLGIIVAAIFTGIVQASAATIGIVLTAAMGGLITLKAAIPLLLGANIGTCITALLGSIGASRKGKQVALAHIIFKVIGVALVFVILGPFTKLIALTAKDLPRQIANAHTIFNVGIMIVFLPFFGLFLKLIQRLLPSRPEEEVIFGPKYLDERILETPSLAIEQAHREIIRAANTTKWMLRNSIDVFGKGDLNLLEEVKRKDDEVDILNKAVVKYLSKLAQQELSDEESRMQSGFLCVLDDLENIGDIISKNIMPLASKMINGS